MSQEIKNFAERAKQSMIGWSTHIDDPHAKEENLEHLEEVGHEKAV